MWRLEEMWRPRQEFKENKGLKASDLKTNKN